MAKENKTMDKRSLTCIAFIKYEIVQLGIASSDKNCPETEIDELRLKIAELIVLLKFLTSSNSIAETVKTLCKWINKGQLLATNATNFFASDEYKQQLIGLDERDVKTLDNIRDKIANTMEIKISDETINNFIDYVAGD